MRGIVWATPEGVKHRSRRWRARSSDPAASAPAASATLARVSPAEGPDGLLGRPLPDLALPDSRGGDYRLRQFVSHRPLVLFFYVLNGSPG